MLHWLAITWGDMNFSGEGHFLKGPARAQENSTGSQCVELKANQSMPYVSLVKWWTDHLFPKKLPSYNIIYWSKVFFSSLVFQNFHNICVPLCRPTGAGDRFYIFMEPCELFILSQDHPSYNMEGINWWKLHRISSCSLISTCPETLLWRQYRRRQSWAWSTSVSCSQPSQPPCPSHPWWVFDQLDLPALWLIIYTVRPWILI